ncbi:uncharacterized protein IL334_000939 [Kwoniella shivajii]|uniref:FAD/NAD(P)-binding domain-containing protein n=1 Tax=Kwoniella shivajii TaxID=564305 RepID=A0ABZ1CQK3_9TREE|nr:hypothetical protein IL334_000939 [Kwoniella shivajii]
MARETYENIVIIGASVAGHALANELIPIIPRTHRILLIDALDYSFYPIAALRASVVPGWEDKIVVPLKTSTVFTEFSQHQVIAPNKVVELRKNSIILEKPFEGSTELPFFKAVVATGSTQPSPMRPSADWTGINDYKKALINSQEETKKAKKIVIVGGGTVGVEWAGEVRAAYPDKEITIVHNRSSLLAPDSNGKSTNTTPESWSSPPTAPKLSKSLVSLAEQNKVKLILNDKVIIPKHQVSQGEWDGSFGRQKRGLVRVKTEKGKTIEADYVFLSIGNKPNSTLVRKADSNAVEGSGLIRVDDNLKVAATSDSSPLSGNNYYAIGDCTAAPGFKTAYLGGVQGKVVATNLVNEIKGKALTKYSPGTFTGLVVPFGPELGAGSITLPYLGTWAVGNGMVKSLKGKGLFIDMFLKSFKGSEKV